jgi:hypothetical protein
LYIGGNQEGERIKPKGGSDGGGLEYFSITKNWVARLSSHPSAFFGTVAAYLRASFAVFNIVPITFLSTCITYISAQSAGLLCKLAVH